MNLPRNFRKTQKLFVVSKPLPGLRIHSRFIRHVPFMLKVKLLRDRIKGSDGEGLRTLRLFEVHGAIFIRIPKNASSSLCKFLYGAEYKDIWPLHVSAEYYRRTIPQHFANTPVVACLREPFARFKSAFNCYRYTSPFPEEREILSTCVGQEGSFDDFIHYLQRQKDLDRTPIMRWLHFRRQSDFICSEDGRLIVDVLFTTEKLDLGIAALRDLVQTPLPADIGVENASIKDDCGFKIPKNLAAFYQDDVRLWEATFNERVLYPMKDGTRITQADHI